MRPLTVVTGFVLGSCASIALSLALVLVVFLFLGDDYPRLQLEFRPLLTSMSIFLVMTTIAAGSFYSLLIRHPSRIWLQPVLWSAIVLTGWYYWP